ncbi:MAG: deoxynucleoside kinase [Oscillospiraceae bacterium]|nr:deoxynucleoside kinase [Oscillospiraceae bacterium]
MTSKIIIIEGLDGCGKSTQLALLEARFRDCRFLTFPNYDSPAGEIITEYLSGELSESGPLHSAYSASTFYAADRYISYRKDWRVDWLSGRTIISARYTTSNAIYQMTKLDRSQWEDYCRWLYDYEYEKLGIPAPDAVIFLDVPVEVSQKLLTARYAGDEGRKDIHEADPEYLKRCREAVRYAAGHDPYAKWYMLNCCYDGELRTPESIHKELVRMIGNIINGGEQT